MRSNYRRFLTEIVVLEHKKWHFRASRFKIFLGGMHPDPPSQRRLRCLKPSGGWTVCKMNRSNVQVKQSNDIGQFTISQAFSWN